MKKKDRNALAERATDWELYWLQRSIETREHNASVPDEPRIGW